MKDEIYTHRSIAIGKFRILLENKSYSLVERLDANCIERYIIVYGLDINAREWKYGIYYNDLEKAIYDFKNEYSNR